MMYAKKYKISLHYYTKQRYYKVSLKYEVLKDLCAVTKI